MFYESRVIFIILIYDIQYKYNKLIIDNVYDKLIIISITHQC